MGRRFQGMPALFREKILLTNSNIKGRITNSDPGTNRARDRE